jgi:signal transduction histidine kinase
MVATEAATLERPDDATIQGDPERVKQLFENLFRNAVEHAGSAVTITVGILDDGFYVADNGPGIPAGERDQAFEAHDWSITVTDSESSGARFEITGVDVST